MFFPVKQSYHQLLNNATTENIKMFDSDLENGIYFLVVNFQEEKFDRIDKGVVKHQENFYEIWVGEVSLNIKHCYILIKTGKYIQDIYLRNIFKTLISW